MNIKNKTQFQKDHIPWNKDNGINKTCQICGKIFYIILSRHKDNRGKFCSKKCMKNRFIKASNEFVLNKDMAELIGIVIGDGCISKYSNQNSYRIFISGNPVEDKYYLENHVVRLIKKCIKQKPSIYHGKNGALIVQFQNEAFRLFLKNLGIAERKSGTVKIPRQIMEDPKLLRRCIKGIADTDFTLIFTKAHKNKNHYPRISANFKSRNLVKDLEKALRSMNFTLNTTYDFKQEDKKRKKSWIINSIKLDGPHNLDRWLKLINFSNIRIISRYEVWKKNGYLKPNTTLPERLEELGWVGGDKK
ncbi:MAG: hypothetical protein AABW91_01285 [Nanoarchaeota archaeon]